MPPIPSVPTYKLPLSGDKIIRRALRLLGSLGQGENPSAADQSEGLEALNGLLDSWNAESLIVPARTKTAKTLVSGTQSYTIGESGDINVARPPQIIQGEAYIQDGSQEYELRVYSAAEWASIYQKTLTSWRPSVLYYEPSAPLGRVWLWQVPDSSAYILNLWLPTLLSQIQGVTDIFYLPPGYAEALLFNLAVRLAEEWGKQLSPTTIELANNSLARIKAMNATLPSMVCDRAMLTYNLGDGLVAWDIRSGGFLI